ncbi:unnamed protein product [Closterium sp. NIES-53]
MGYDTSRCRTALQLLELPAPRASRLAAARTSRPAALRIVPFCNQRVALCCLARRALLQPTRRALLQPSRRALLQPTLLWHHRLGHPSLPRLRSMHSRLLVSGFPKSLPSLPRPPALPCLPCVEGRQRAALHSSEFPPTTAPLQTLHLDVWGPAHVGGTDQDRYFLLVVEDYTRYTTVFSLRRKADVSGVLIPRIHATRRQLRDRFSEDFPVLRLHSDRGSEFSSDLLAEFYRDEGIVHSFTLPSSPQQNEIPERRIGLVMEVARTSMIHAAAPYFLWPFAVRYAAHQLNLWPRVSEPETSPTLRWMGKVGDASVFRVWGALSLVRDPKASKLSSRTLRCVLLGFPTDAPSWQFHYPRERRVFSSQDVTFDESVCFYRLHPHASHPARGSSTTRASVESSPPSQRVALCCPTRRALLPCTARALLPCPPSALSCSPRRALPGRAAPPSLSRPAQPKPRRPTLITSPTEQRCPGRAAPPSPSHPPTTTTAAAVRRWRRWRHGHGGEL